LVINHNRRFNPNYRRLRDLVAEGKLGELSSGTIRWGNGRLGNVGTHMLDALAMLTGRKIVAVSATLDLSRKPDCRGPEFADPGGFGWVRLESGLMVSVDAADYARGPGEIILNGTLGRATAGGPSVALKFWDGSSADWPAPAPSVSSMDRAVEEIVAALDGKSPFPYDPANGVRTLEAIVAFHASHARGSAWVNLPLEGSDRKIEVLSG
jgi:predicted dehydrogenase